MDTERDRYSMHSSKAHFISWSGREERKIPKSGHAQFILSPSPAAGPLPVDSPPCLHLSQLPTFQVFISEIKESPKRSTRVYVCVCW